MRDGQRRATSQDVVGLCSDLISINTSNPTHPEAEAAAYVAAALAECGVGCEWIEPAPGRVSLVARLQGQDPSLAPLLLHAHLDTVPAVSADWSQDPFAGTVADGYVWGRGAIDMKGMVAAMIAVASAFEHNRRRPRRDVILAFFADEEAGGRLGSAHVVATRPDLFAGCEVAIGEVGGFSRSIGSRRAYLVATAEKGVLWARLSAIGTPGHASMLNDDNSIAVLSEALTRISRHEFAEDVTAATGLWLECMAAMLDLDEEDREAILDTLGPEARMLGAGLRDTLSPTTVDAGYKVNVVPREAVATVDGRFLPGHAESLAKTLTELAGDRVVVEPIFQGDALESPWNDPLVVAIQASLSSKDPDAVAVPYMSTAFTDAKWLSQLGIRCYGFCPMRLPDDLDFTALFHGTDERVPVASLQFCVEVLTHLLETF